MDGIGQARKGVDVEPIVAIDVELDRLSGDEQERGFRIVVADGLAQVGQRAPQIGTSGAFGLFSPQQPGQLFAAVRAFCFNHQVGQQRPYLVRFKASDQFPIQGHLKGSKQTN